MTARRKPAPAPVTEADLVELKSPEAERSVLGAILIDGRGLDRAAAIVSAADFQVEQNRISFAAALRLHVRGDAIDPVTLRDELERAGELEVAGGVAYIALLPDGVPHSSNVEFYAKIVRGKAVRRGLMSSGIEFTRACTNGHSPAELTEAAAVLYRAALDSDPEAKRRVCSTAEALDAYAADIATGPSRKIKSGFAPLDALTEGIAPGEVLTAVARPQVGKSALASQMIVNASLDGIASVFFSLEMPRPQAVERLLQQRLGMTRHEVERHAKSGWRELTDAQRESRDALARSVVVVDRGKSGIADLDASMIEATAILGRPPRLAIVDFIGLLGSGSRNLKLYERVSEAACDLKSFAKRHTVALVALSQAGRDPDRRKSEGAAELGLDAARDSGQIEEGADFLLTLWREELDSALKPDARAEVRGELSASLCKNRRGPQGKFRLHFDGATLRIRQWGVEP